MNVDAARRWLIKASLTITGLYFVFFFTAPAMGYPLTFEQSIRILEIVLPVFLGYLGNGTYFLFKTHEPNIKRTLKGSPELFRLLVIGPILVFAAASIAAIIAFGLSNRASAPPGSGMNVDLLAGAMSASLGLLAVTTNIIVSYLFSAGESSGKERL